MKVESEKSHVKTGPAAVRYAKLLINQLYLSSVEEKAIDLVHVGYPYDPNNPEELVRIFRGYINNAGLECGLSKSNSRIAIRLLHAMRATTILKTGTPKTPTILLLSYRPDDKQYDEFSDRSEMLGRTLAPTGRLDTIEAELKHLQERVKALEARLLLSNSEE